MAMFVANVHIRKTMDKMDTIMVVFTFRPNRSLDFKEKVLKSVQLVS